MPINRITRRLLAAAITTTLAVGAVAVLPAALEQDSAEAKGRKKRSVKVSLGGSNGSGSGSGSGGSVSGSLVAPNQAARSTTVALSNKTGCTLEYVSEDLDEAIWAPDLNPNRGGNPTKIEDGKQWTFASQSLVPLMGTEGTTEWRTTNCDDAALADKKVKFNWTNKYLQRNTHDFDGTDPALKGELDDVFGNGWGVHAYAGVTVRPAG